MKNKIKILLTGSGGFIGKNILNLLGDKYNFITPRSTELNLCDSTAVQNYIKNCRPDLVIHGANLGGTRLQKDSDDVLSMNLSMFFNIARCHRYFGRMITFGSGAEYGKQDDISHVQEVDFDKKVPTDRYGLYKYICAQYAQRVDFITHLRIFGIFGKYEDCCIRFISNNICRALLNLPISINQDVYFDYIFVDDFVKIVDYFIIHQGKEKTYNVGTGQRVLLSDVAKKIKQQSGKNLEIKIKKDGFNKEYSCDITRLRKEIPDLKFTKIDEAISKLFLFYSKQINTIKKEDILFE
ncbi:MAG: NAD(P)-dependent oxidoreductase [Candidatus Magasanikbacteria bacterium]|jgi:GDP-L-fucose synthase